MTKEKSVLTKVSKKVVSSKKPIITKKESERQEEKKRIQEIKDFDKSEKFLFTCFDITEDTVLTTIFPDERGFFEKYLQFYISKRREFLAELKKNKTTLNKK